MFDTYGQRRKTGGEMKKVEYYVLILHSFDVSLSPSKELFSDKRKTIIFTYSC